MKSDHASPHGIDCERAFERLFDFLDGEVDEDLDRRIREHFAKCKPCYERADFERRFLAAVAAARSTRTGSGALRDRVVGALRAEGWEG